MAEDTGTSKVYDHSYLLSFQQKVPPSESVAKVFELKHPCERYGNCKFGERCLFKEMPREWCRDCLAGEEHDSCWGTQPETHPCLRVWGVCRFTQTCIYRNLPKIWCLFCLRHQQHTKCSGIRPSHIPDFITKAVDKAHAKQAYKEAKKKKRKERQEAARKDAAAQAQAVAMAAAVVAAGSQPTTSIAGLANSSTSGNNPPPYQPPSGPTQQQHQQTVQALLASAGSASGVYNRSLFPTTTPAGTGGASPAADAYARSKSGVGGEHTGLSVSEVEKKLITLLSGIAPVTYSKLVEEITTLLAQQPEEILRAAAHRVHEKAIMEKFNVALYVDMVYNLVNTLPEAFRNQVLNQCKAQLHGVVAVPGEGASEEELEQFKLHRQRDKGNITLIALLFKRKVVPDPVMVDVVTFLITYKGPHVDDKIEDLCLLFTEAGQELETAKMVQQRPGYL